MGNPQDKPPQLPRIEQPTERLQAPPKSGKPGQAPPPPPPPPPPQYAPPGGPPPEGGGNRKAILAVLAVLLTLLIGGGAAYAIFSGSGDDESAPKTAGDPEEPETRPDPDADPPGDDPDARDEPVDVPLETVRFRTPVGHIYCGMSSQTGVLCVISAGDIPAAKQATTGESYRETWTRCGGPGELPAVELDEFGAGGTCVDADSIADIVDQTDARFDFENVRRLSEADYDVPMSAGAYTCDVTLESGVSCENLDTGTGFRRFESGNDPFG